MENDQNFTPVPTPTFWQKYKNIFISVALILVIVVSGWFLFQTSNKNNSAANSDSNTSVYKIVNNDQSPTSKDEIKPVPNDQYDLFRYVDNGSQYVVVPTVKYKDDGTIESGKYSGYHRIAASADYGELGSRNVIFFFATKDYKQFVLDRGSEEYYQEQTLDKSKIREMGDIEPAFPKTIKLNNFTLTKSEYDLSPVFSTTTKLAGTVPGLDFHTDRSDYFSNGIKKTENYIEGNSRIYAIDKYGLAASYNLETSEWEERAKNKENYYEYDFYKDIDISTSEPIYKKYGQLIPGGCGQIGVSFVLKNIKKDELSLIGKTKRGLEVFVLKDKNHPIYKDQYESKVTEWKSMFATLNDIEPPTYDAYVSKNPVIILKDDLGRWLALGEWEYQTGGGCGKPVIYLYPEKTTDVSIKFTNAMVFSVDIPKYDGGWKVSANPDGTLIDLQPEKTNCEELNTKLPGSEYAKEACIKNTYPYIYWAGYTTNLYPHTDEGWIVKKDEVESFLSKTLSEMGLNDREKNDFLEYWIPKLKAKNSPYFKISFFQTKDMEKFVPMEVNPKPDTVFRVFLDWEPIDQIPQVAPSPQLLEKLNRKGFTLVEWGGVNK
jgi:hypothetical protein